MGITTISYLSPSQRKSSEPQEKQWPDNIHCHRNVLLHLPLLPVYMRKCKVMDQSSRQILNREITELTDVMTQVDLTDVYNTFHPNTEECTFSSPHGTFTKTDHILIHKASHSKYKKIEKSPCILSYHHGWLISMRDLTFSKEKRRRSGLMELKGEEEGDTGIMM